MLLEIGLIERIAHGLTVDFNKAVHETSWKALGFGITTESPGHELLRHLDRFIVAIHQVRLRIRRCVCISMITHLSLGGRK